MDWIKYEYNALNLENVKKHTCVKIEGKKLVTMVFSNEIDIHEHKYSLILYLNLMKYEYNAKTLENENKHTCV